MPIKTRSQAQLLQDRALIAEYHLKGWTQKAIAEKLNITTSTVKYDLKKIEEDWRLSAAFDFEQDKQRQLAQNDLVLREAWAAWEGSKAPRERTRTRTAKRTPAEADGLGSTSNSAEKLTEQRDPDPRYLVIIQSCIDARAKILGEYAPVGVNVHHAGTVKQVTEFVYELPPQEPVAGLTIIGGVRAPALSAGDDQVDALEQTPTAFEQVP